MLSEQSEGSIWDEANAALKEGNDERAIALLTPLADTGDWRAAISLGYVYEKRGNQNSVSYVHAAHWFTNALSKEDHPEAHLGLARYYYYGLSGSPDYRRAREHLEKASPSQTPEAALMLGTLYYIGKGVDRDIARAKSYYEIAANAVFPLAMIHLSRIWISEGKWGKGFLLAFRGLVQLVRLRLSNAKDPRLVGFFR